MVYYQIKKAVDVSSLAKIQGMDLEKAHDVHSFIESFSTMGLQASELAKAIDIVTMMRREQAAIYLSFTSNMVSSGVREVITYLVKHKHIHIISTSAGGVEEDALKAYAPFRLGSFSVSGEWLFNQGLSRIGNIYTTTDHYAYFEQFMQSVFAKLYEQQKKTGQCATPSVIARMIGQELEAHPDFDHEQSYLYWAYKQNIPVYCPGIMDGSIGDLLYFFKQKHPDFLIDVTGDHKQLIDTTLSFDKTGAIILGGGIAKHYVLNANIFREGLDYSVYITTAVEFDGSDSGGSGQEAISWAKLQLRSPHVRVTCDASIAAPLLIYGAFVPKKEA